MPAENGMPESEDVRKKALVRLSVAAIVTATALGALWWLDQSGDGHQESAPAAPAPIVAAPQPEVAAPTAEAPATSTDTLTDAASGETQASPAEDIPPETPPPPPKVSNNLITPGRATAQVTPTLPPVIQQQPAIRPAARPAIEPSTSAVSPAMSDQGFVVQLGVFSNPDNARELVEKLKKQGIRAHLEARVQMGPFLNRREAEKAQAEMRKLGYTPLITLPFAAAAATK